VSCAKTAESIEVPFRMWTGVVPRKHDLDAGAHARRRNLANTTEPFMCCGDAALCQITLTTCFNNCTNC